MKVTPITTDIDVTFDFRRDTPEGKDPDSYSETLRSYHKLLWSKRLPGGAMFDLTIHGRCLHHRSELGEFILSSDAVIPTFKWNDRIRALISEEELQAFNAAGYTIGGMMLWPANQTDGKWTINQARGCTPQIGDRFDLTLECVRRHYSKNPSPLSDVFRRYARFFELFGDFRGFVEFFLLQDLVNVDFSVVRLSVPFDDFNGSPIPSSVEEYKSYESASRAFVEARNQRILNYLAQSKGV